VDIVQKLEYAIQPSQTFALAFVDIDNYPSSIEAFQVLFICI